MPDKTIDQLDAAGTLTGAEKVPMSQGGLTVEQTLTIIQTFVLAAYAGGTGIVTTGTVTTGTWFSRIKPRITSTTSTATLTLNSDTEDVAILSAQAAPFAIANPVGTPDNCQEIRYRIKDNGSSWAITFGAKFRFSSSLAAPAATTINKTMYMKFSYHSGDDKWDMVEYLDNF